MEDKNIEKNKSRLKIYYSLLITIICIIGVSFAWFRLYLSQRENNTLASRTCFNTTLTEETSKIALTDEFPIVDEKGLKVILKFYVYVDGWCNDENLWFGNIQPTNIDEWFTSYRAAVLKYSKISFYGTHAKITDTKIPVIPIINETEFNIRFLVLS